MKRSLLTCFRVRMIIAVCVCAAVSSAAYAEYIFKKDGPIIEGKIIAEGGTSITVMTSDKKRQVIPRKDVMRVIFTKLYLGKVFVRMTNGETLEGYVVDEDQDTYFVRKTIDKPEEIKIPRVKVMFIARSNPTDLVGTATHHEISVKWSAPYIPGKKYQIYVKAPKENDFSKLTQVSGTSYTLSKLKSNATFRIYVTSIDDTGVESLPSEQIEVTTLNNPPTEPGNIQKEVITNSDPKKTGIRLSWDASQDTDGAVAEYRIYKQMSDGNDLKLGSSKTTDFFIKDGDLAGVDFVRVVAVDNNGTESDDAKYMIGAALEMKTPYLRVRPVGVYPFGKMGKLYGFGFGSGIGLYTNGYLFRNSQIGIESGYIRWTGKNDDIKKMQMIPFQLSIGLHHFFTQRLFVTGSIGGGIVYMTTSYTNSSDQNKTKNAIESIVSGSLSMGYAVSPRFYLFGGGDYSAIYETGGIKHFAGAHLGIGVRL